MLKVSEPDEDEDIVLIMDGNVLIPSRRGGKSKAEIIQVATTSSCEMEHYWMWKSERAKDSIRNLERQNISKMYFRVHSSKVEEIFLT
ncbi:hypothetical protein TNIN_478081 [Trichonephila inaurata madagascariensis]|uniref:Uncharacterized protein n=1 Tax=Trichonephila inaurata madagascariensis TaxID=2747483 RepID=A0A8X7CPM8_9ARAC|nr:hypothetical protein TNIN_478081 [Trichonephila inaurata madagascariensis]